MGVPKAKKSRAQPRRHEGASPARGLVTLEAVGSYAADNLYRTRELHEPYVLGYAHGLERAHRALGRCLHQYVEQTGERPLLALGDAGAIPYYCDLPTIDCWGLNNKTIALSGVRDAEHVLARKPDIVVLISEHPDFYDKNRWRNAIYAGCKAEGMEVSAVLTFLEEEYYLWVLTRPNSRLGDFIKRRHWKPQQRRECRGDVGGR